MALKETIESLAAGAMILTMGYFRVGELVTIAGETGFVKSISLLSTHLLTVQRQSVHIRNFAVTSAVIENWSENGKIRVAVVFPISYSAAIPQAKQLLLNVLLANEAIMIDPPPFVAVSSLADSAVELTAFAWVPPNLFFDLQRDIRKAGHSVLTSAGFLHPLPQRDAHLVSTHKVHVGEREQEKMRQRTVLSEMGSEDDLLIAEDIRVETMRLDDWLATQSELYYE